MQVTLNVTRGDILRLNLSKILTAKANLICFGFSILLAAGVAFANYLDDPADFGWRWFALFTLVGGIFIFILIFLISLFFVLINSTVGSGALGEHTFTIEEAGLREETVANDSLSYWSGLQRVEKTRSAIFVQTTPWLFHILPRREFASDDEFETFHKEVASRVGKNQG